MNYVKKYLKYKKKYLDLLQNLEGGTLPSTPKQCYIYYKELINKLSTNNTINILDFHKYCDDSIFLDTKIFEQIDHNDYCYRVSSELNKSMYKHKYDPYWFDDLIKQVAKEKVIQSCISFIDNLIHKKELKYKSTEIKQMEKEINELILKIQYEKSIDDLSEIYKMLKTYILNTELDEYDTYHLIINCITTKLYNIYYDNFKSMFDITKKDNCCNCITIVLYKCCGGSDEIC